jgi:hypothetical protein
MSDKVPHIWHTIDPDGGDCKHLAMCEEGAIQAHMLHHGLLSYDKTIVAKDLGKITVKTDRADICFDPNDLLYSLSFPDDG